MRRLMIGSVLSVCLSSALAAPLTSATYGQQLLSMVAKAHPQLLAAAISATPPKASASVIIASTRAADIGAPASPADLAVMSSGASSVTAGDGANQLVVRVSLHDVSGDPIGVLALTYSASPGSDRSALTKDAEQIRDALHRRISHAGNLLDAYPYDAEISADTYAQKLVDETLDKYPEIEILAIHATPPESDYNVIAGSNIGRIGKKADNDDMRCIYTGKPNLEVNSTGKRFESEMVLHDRAGHLIGAVGIVVAYKAGDDKAALLAHAEKIRADIQQHIADSASLFKPAG